MTEQDLRDEFEHEAWCDTQNNISKVCNCMMGYPLEVIENLQETIAELESRIEQSVDISVVNQLNETIKAKDAEIKELESELGRVFIQLKGTAQEFVDKDKAIAEARELIDLLIYNPMSHDVERAKAWLESNSI